MSDISSISGGNQTQSDLLVEAFKQSQQYKVDALNARKATLESRKSFFNTLNGKLNSIVSNIDTFTASDAASKFFTRKISTSDSNVITASANSDAVVGLSQVSVERLATNDILVSDRLNQSDAFGMAAGTYAFDLIVNGETLNVSVDLEGSETNLEAMTKIVNAINDDDEFELSAQVIKDSSSTARVTLTSTETGAENNITFSDSSLLAQLGFTSALNAGTTSRTQMGEATAGFQNSNYEDLNALLEVNGINVTRGSNSIDDLLSGVTLNLLKPQETDDLPITLTTEVDGKAVEELIEPLLSNYNNLLTYLQSNRRTQRADSSVSSLYSRIRALVSQPVSGLEEDAPKFLTDIGLKINSDGTLAVGDSEKLLEMLREDPQQVADIFTSDDGFIKKLESSIENLTGSGGLVSSRTLSLSSQIDTTVDRTEELQARIDRQALTLRKEYEDTLRVFLEAQSQLSLLSGYSGGTGSSLMYY